MVCDVDNCLLGLVADKLDFVFGCQHGGRLALLAGRVPHAHLDGTGVSLLTVLAEVLEQESIATMALDGMRAVKDALTPTRRAAVQGIRSIVLGQLDRLSVQLIDNAVLDTVGHTANGRAVVCSVILDILLLRGEAKHDVVATDAEFLDNSAERQESEFGLFGGRHGAGDMYRTVISDCDGDFISVNEEKVNMKYLCWRGFRRNCGMSGLA